jgi:V-type H+-transporting ATPase subunit G
VDQETDAKISEIRAAAADKKDVAVELMLKSIINVVTEPHINARV